MNTKVIKDCPFCGSRGAEGFDEGESPEWFVYCPNTSCFLHDIGTDLIRWNTRAPSVPASELEKQRHELYCFGDNQLASEYPDGMWQTGFRYCLKEALEMFDELITKAKDRA